MVKPRETTWNDVKTELLQFDRTGLLGLLKDLYALRPENRAFLAARFGIGSDPLTPFKKWWTLRPRISRPHQRSVTFRWRRPRRRSPTIARRSAGPRASLS